MEHRVTNPYASPVAEAPGPPPRSETPRFAPLWWWLAVAVLVSVGATPADPFSVLLALAFGLLMFCGGAFAGSTRGLLYRSIAVAVCTALWGLFTAAGVTVAVVAAVYALASGFMGAWAIRSLGYRVRIMLGFAIGYSTGAVLGILGLTGVVVGAVLGAKLAALTLSSDDR